MVDPPESPGKRLRDEAAERTALAAGRLGMAETELRKAEAAFKREERLDEERTKRWWRAETAREPPSAVTQMDRAYRSQVRMLEARLKLTQATLRASEAESTLNQQLWLAEELESARLKRALRRYTRKSSVRSNAGSGKRVKA